MKRDIQTKMKKLKKRLDYQEEKMLDQKDSVEDLMGNIITGGLREGSAKKCAMDPYKLYEDYETQGMARSSAQMEKYVEDFLTEGCAGVLDN